MSGWQESPLLHLRTSRVLPRVPFFYATPRAPFAGAQISWGGVPKLSERQVVAGAVIVNCLLFFSRNPPPRPFVLGAQPRSSTLQSRNYGAGCRNPRTGHLPSSVFVGAGVFLRQSSIFRNRPPRPIFPTPYSANQMSSARRPKALRSPGLVGAEFFPRTYPYFQNLLFRPISRYPASRPNAATRKSWGRALKSSQGSGIMGAGAPPLPVPFL